MAMPLSQDYNEAIQSPAASFKDAELKQGEAVNNALGLPMPRSGNFADVYEFKCPRRKWAIKCFTREIPGLRERYQEISAYLKQTPLPFMVDFSYLEQGIRVHGNWFPALKMQWVEGFTLNDFVRQQLDKPQILDVLCQIWVKLAARLRDGQMAHCDLQHGNVLLVPGSKATSLAIKLVDYDGMCVPALTMLKSIEVGHPNFQHPQRARDSIYSLDVDRFSHLAIYTALRALMTGGRPLWEKFDNGDNLLFKQADFEAPDRSPVFQELAQSSDVVVQTMSALLGEAAQRPLDQTPHLSEVAPGAKKSAAVTKSVPAAAPKVETVVPTVEDLFAEATAPSDETPVRTGRRQRGEQRSKTPMLVAAGIGGVVVLAGMVTGAVLLFGGNKAQDERDVDSVVQSAPDQDKDELALQEADDKDKRKPLTRTRKPEPLPIAAGEVKIPEPRPTVVVNPLPAQAKELGLCFKGRGHVELADTKGMLNDDSPFTIEIWFRLPDVSTTQEIVGDLVSGFDQFPDKAIGGWQVTARREGPVFHPSLQVNSSTSATGVSDSGLLTMTPMQWHHLAIVRTPGRIVVYNDGHATMFGSFKSKMTNSPINIALGVAKERKRAGLTFDGDIRAFRISSGAGYTQNFTPAQQFTKDADTLVLLDFSRGEGDRVTDLSGHNHHGKINGANWIGKAPMTVDVKQPPAVDVTQPPAVMEARSLRFKGRSYVELADTKDMLDLSEPFTIETWLRLPDVTTSQEIAGDMVAGIDKFPGNAFGGWQLAARRTNTPEGSVFRPSLNVMTNPNSASGFGLGSLIPMQWHHLAVVRSATSIRVYVDGKSTGGGAFTSKTTKSPINIALGIAKERKRTSLTFDGDIRAFRISAAARYTQDFTPEQQFAKDPATLVLLDFSRGQGDELPDLSGNNHHGKISGAVWESKGPVAVVTPAVLAPAVARPVPKPAASKKLPRAVLPEARGKLKRLPKIIQFSEADKASLVIGRDTEYWDLIKMFSQGGSMGGFEQLAWCPFPDGRGSAFSTAGQRESFRITGPTGLRQVPGNDPATNLAASADGTRVLSGHADGQLTFWDIEPRIPTALRQIRPESNAVAHLGLSPDGTRAVVLYGNGKVWRWNTGEAEPTKIASTLPMLMSMALSGDGKQAVLGHTTKAWLWNIDTDEGVYELAKSARLAAFTPDGRILLAGGDGVIRILDAKTGQETHRLLGHQAEVVCIAFSRDGKTLLSAGKDMVLNRWRLP